MPVSVSTETSAICTPPTPLLVRSGGLLLVGILAANGQRHRAHASRKLLSRRGYGWIGFDADFAVLRFQVAPALALSAGATFANSVSRASTDARRVEELTPPMVVLTARASGGRIACVADIELDRVHRNAERVGGNHEDAGAGAGAEILRCPS